MSPSYCALKFRNSSGHFQSSSPLSVQRHLMPNRSLFSRHWHDWAQGLQTEQSAFSNKSPSWQKGTTVRREPCFLLVSILAVVRGWIHALVEHFSPGGLSCSNFQSCVAGYESPEHTRPQFSPAYSLISWGMQLVITWFLQVIESQTHGDTSFMLWWDQSSFACSDSFFLQMTMWCDSIPS